MCTDGQPRTKTAHVGQNHPNSPRKGQRAESRTSVLICVLMDSHDVPCLLTDTHGHTRTATDVMCVLTDSHRQPWTSYSPRGPKSPKQSTGRVSLLSPRTSVLICVLMDSHRRPVCADGHT
ncbi:unnamed protein product [Brassica rapa]|uniref:Uncharacterized protein n=1 Tax=Brassica campestris TaxID=3711 RepID=A0A8D9CT10_BRACM|nr:unnamed protein product [Brassica rapa]